MSDADGFPVTVPASRHRLLDGVSPQRLPDVQRLRQLLLAQDGSATLLCETLAGGPVALVLHHQVVSAEVPALVRQWLPGTKFLERRVSLQAHGQVMMDNLSWIALAALPDEVAEALLAGRQPIGHLLARMWTRRQPVPAAQPLWQRLWDQAGLPDDEAVRSYCVSTPEGPVMLITECFRQGMWRQPPGSEAFPVV